MKRAILIATAIAGSLLLANCEKDDICDPNTATTPRMVIFFYDINNPTVRKDVTDLAVFGEDLELPLAVTNTDSLLVPLRTDVDLTSYRFVLNSSDPGTINEDRIGFTYARNDIFVSRACGYKTIFEMDELAPFALDPSTDGPWIQNIILEQPSIETEDETHLNIYL